MNQLTTTQRLALFETAQETIGLLIASRSSLIWTERDKKQPDVSLIAQWELERTEFHNEQDALRFDDEQSIRAVLEKYGPIVRDLMKPSPQQSQIHRMTA